MRKKHLISYFDTQCSTMSGNLKKICKDGDQKALHDLRVAIKKIKSLAWLTDKCYKQDALKKEVKEISRLFKEAGIVRNAQLCMQYMQENKPVHKKFEIEQQQIIDTGLAAFIAHYKLYETQIRTLKTRLKMHAKGISFAKAFKIIEKRRRKIMLFLQTDISKESELLHNCRKQIKSLFFIHQLFLACDQKKMLKHISIWNKVQEAIGSWHDVEFFQQELYSSKASKDRLKKMALHATQKRLDIQQIVARLVSE